MSGEQRFDTLGAALDDVSVIQWGASIACGYAAKMLADLGARVVMVNDLPSVSRNSESVSFLDEYLDRAKEPYVLNLDDAEGHAAFFQLLETADILIEDHSPAQLQSLDLTYSRLSEINPKLVVVSVTPYGQTGPYKDFRAGDLEIAFLSSLAHLTPRDISSTGTDDQTPLKMPGSLVSIYAGVSTAGAALAALRGRQIGDRGAHVDVSMLETLIPTLRRELALHQYEGITASRFMRVWKLAPWGVKECKDGHVFLQVVEKHHWQGLVDMMGNPEWALDSCYLDPDYRYEHRTDIEARLAPWLKTQLKKSFAWEAQRRSVPFAPVNTVADIMNIPQLHHRRFFTTSNAANGYPYIALSDPFKVSHHMSAFNNEEPQAPTSTASTKNEPTDGVRRRGPLDGVRILDFGHVWAGPYCAATLADMGADVIKIESEHRIDIHRRQGPYPDKNPGLNRSGVWNSQNRGKRSIALNLSTPQGRELARSLVATSDVVIENFAPGVMQRLGLDYASLCAVKPDIVMASLSAFGQDGPQHQYVGYGPSLDAWAGLDSLTAYKEGPPNALGGIFPDTGSALYGAAAILAALRLRDRTGIGRYIDVSELEVSILLLTDVVLEQINRSDIKAEGNGSTTTFPQGCYRCEGEDHWIALSTPDSASWRGLCSVIDRSDWANDETLNENSGRHARRQEIESSISLWAKGQTAQMAMQHLQSAGVPAGFSHNASSLLSDPHLMARQFFKPVEHPEMGQQSVYGAIWRISDYPDTIHCAAPLLGEHSRQILSERLKLDKHEIDSLIASKVVY